jgi:hypothetical protein
LPQHHADTFGNHRAAGGYILTRGVQGALKIVKSRQEGDHQVGRGELPCLFVLSGRTFAIIIEVRHETEQLLPCGLVLLGFLGKGCL